MMHEQQLALKKFEEELGELAIEILKLQQVLSKTILFGPDSWDPETGEENLAAIKREWNDVLGSMVHASRVGIDIAPDLKAIEAKVKKIQKYS